MKTLLPDLFASLTVTTSVFTFLFVLITVYLYGPVPWIWPATFLLILVTFLFHLLSTYFEKSL